MPPSEGQAGPAAFRVVSESTLHQGPLIRVAEVEVAAPDGSKLHREVVRHPGAVVVVPVEADRRVLMVRQYRAAVDGELLELPAGKRDVASEPTEVTAARELAEEVGRHAGRLDLLARFYNSPGFADELAFLYLARDLQEVPDSRQGVEEQHMTVEAIPLDDADRLIAEGQIIDAKSIIGLCLARSFLDRGR